MFICTDGHCNWVDDGDAWRPILPSGKVGTAPASAASWTALSGSTAVMSDSFGLLKIALSNANSVWTGVSLGATYQLDLQFQLCPGKWSATAAALFGFALRNSVTGRITRAAIYYSTDEWTFEKHDFDDRTTSHASPEASIALPDFAAATSHWHLRIVKDATYLNYYVVRNGEPSFLYREAKAFWSDPDTFGLWTDADGGDGGSVIVFEARKS